MKNKTVGLARSLNDTNYITKAARRYLSTICKNAIIAPKGVLTAKVRKIWGLNKILSEDNIKNREDHRHHAIDAIVVGCITHSLIKKTTINTKSRFEIPQPLKNIRNQIFQTIENKYVSHRHNHSLSGALHEESYFGPNGKKYLLPDNDKMKPFFDLSVEKNDIKHIKYAKYGSVFQLDVWELPNNTVKCVPIYFYDYKTKYEKNKLNDLKPHPAARKVQTFRKNDIVKIKNEGFYIVSGINSTCKRLELYPINYAGKRDGGEFQMRIGFGSSMKIHNWYDVCIKVYWVISDMWKVIEIRSNNNYLSKYRGFLTLKNKDTQKESKIPLDSITVIIVSGFQNNFRQY